LSRDCGRKEGKKRMFTVEAKEDRLKTTTHVYEIYDKNLRETKSRSRFVMTAVN